MPDPGGSGSSYDIGQSRGPINDKWVGSVAERLHCVVRSRSAMKHHGTRTLEDQLNALADEGREPMPTPDGSF